MAKRDDVVASDLYSARDRRLPLQGHPDLAAFPPRFGAAPPLLNAFDPVPPPEMLEHGILSFTMDVPIFLQFQKGKYSPPPHGRRLRSEIWLLNCRLVAEVYYLANSGYRAEQWLTAHNIVSGERRSEYYAVNTRTFRRRCIASLRKSLPHFDQHRSNLDRYDVSAYINKRLHLIELLQMHLRYFDQIYSDLASIGNGNLNGDVARRKEVTLGRLLKPFSRVYYPVVDDELLDVSFHGAIEASMIRMDRYCMSDIFGLAVALGEMRYRAFRPAMDQAHAFLMAAGEMPDVLLCPAWLRPQRRMLADKLMARFCPIAMRERLVELCRAVLYGRAIPERLQTIQYDVLP